MPENVSTRPLPRLLRTPKPRPDESFPGYLLRLTEENSYDSVHWIPERAGLKVYPVHGRWTDLWRPEPDLARLREMTGLSGEELGVLQEQPLPDCLMRWKAPKVCPACLREESWSRKVWDFLPFTACPPHRTVLIDFCPGCHRVFSWARKSVSVCRCGYDWRRIRSPVIGDEELVAARWISSIWRGRNEKSFRLGEATATPLAWEEPAVYPAVLGALMDAWLYLRKGVRLQPTTENEICHRAVAAVASALDDWSEGFFRFFDQFDDPALENWQRAWFGHRSGNLSETQGWLLAAASLEEYLEVRWAGAQAPAVPKRFLSKQEAGQHLGLGVNLIDSLVEQGRLRSLRGVIKRNISRIDYRSLKRLRQEIESLLTVSQAAADLGIGSRQFRDLVRYGFLSPESSLRFERADEPKFSPKALTAFLHRLSGLVTLPDEGHDEFRVVSLSRVADHCVLAAK